jgi:hypothetical protein
MTRSEATAIAESVAKATVDAYAKTKQAVKKADPASTLAARVADAMSGNTAPQVSDVVFGPEGTREPRPGDADWHPGNAADSCNDGLGIASVKSALAANRKANASKASVAENARAVSAAGLTSVEQAVAMVTPKAKPNTASGIAAHIGRQ